ncbi:MAG: hypothetical protein U9Q81_15515 [Pseudomonadota bacterium]|nr:hypothetical protein [Pseudomonadota bacterium]
MRSDRKPDYPTLESLRRLAERGAKGVANVLMWLPMVGERVSSGIALPLHASAFATRNECTRWGFQVLAVRWCEDGRTPGCLLVYHLDSAKVAQRVAAAVNDVVGTMGQDCRMA